jgi:hypothetical protein
VKDVARGTHAREDGGVAGLARRLSRSTPARCHQPLTLVIYVLHRLTGKRVRVRTVGAASDERDDLLRLWA